MRESLIVVEVEVVQEARRLDGAQPQERVNTRLRSCPAPERVTGREPPVEIGHDGAHPTRLRRDPRRVRRLDPLEPEQDAGDASRTRRTSPSMTSATPGGGSPRQRAPPRRTRPAGRDGTPSPCPGRRSARPRRRGRASTTACRAVKRRSPARCRPRAPPRRRWDPHLPPMERPPVRSAQARVERQQVVEDDLAPRRERALGREPDRDRQRHHRERHREDPQRQRECAAVAPADDGDEHDQRRGEQARMGLHGDAGAEREPGPCEARTPRGSLGPARDAERAQQQERAEKEIALPGLPGAAGQVVDARRRAPAPAAASRPQGRASDAAASAVRASQPRSKARQPASPAPKSPSATMWRR